MFRVQGALCLWLPSVRCLWHAASAALLLLLQVCALRGCPDAHPLVPPAHPPTCVALQAAG